MDAIEFDDLFKELQSIGYKFYSPTGDEGTLGAIISQLVPTIFLITGILLLFYLLYGGLQLMLSRGDPKAFESAKGKITNALIGFVIIFAAYWIVQILGRFLGIEAIKDIFQ